MGEDQLLSLILSGGPNVAFAGFLFWQYKEQQKRADDRETKNDQREKELRDRYDKVISDLHTREDAIRTEIVKEINDLDKRMSLLEQKLDIVSTIVEEIKSKVQRAV